MAAPTTSLGNVTVRKLNSVIASLWNKIKNTFAPKDDGQQTHDTTKFYRADGSWAVPTGDLDSVLLTSSDDLDNIHPDDFAVYRWRTTSIPMHAPYGGSGDATMHVLPIGDECCLQFVATCEISNNGIMLEMYRKRYKDGNNYAWTTWAYTDTRYSNATQSSAGLMSASDKTKLDGVATNANNYTHPTTSGNKHIPSGGSSGQILRWSADGTAAWGADNNTTYSQISRGSGAGLAPGLPSGSGTTKYLREDGTWQVPPDTNTTYSQISRGSGAGLAPGLPSGSGTTKYLREDGSWQVPPDNNTTYSAGSGLSLSGTTFSLKTGYTTSGKNYKVQLDSSGNPYVNVPWTDNNTTYSAGSGIGISGTTINNLGIRDCYWDSDNNKLYVDKGGLVTRITINYATTAGSANTVPNGSITPDKLNCGIVSKNGNFFIPRLPTIWTSAAINIANDSNAVAKSARENGYGTPLVVYNGSGSSITVTRTTSGSTATIGAYRCKMFIVTSSGDGFYDPMT